MTALWRAVSCPRCGAAPGQLCVTLLKMDRFKWARSTNPHNARVAAARQHSPHAHTTSMNLDGMCGRALREKREQPAAVRPA